MEFDQTDICDALILCCYGQLRVHGWPACAKLKLRFVEGRPGQPPGHDERCKNWRPSTSTFDLSCELVRIVRQEQITPRRHRRAVVPAIHEHRSQMSRASFPSAKAAVDRTNICDVLILFLRDQLRTMDGRDKPFHDELNVSESHTRSPQGISRADAAFVATDRIAITVNGLETAYPPEARIGNGRL